MPKVSVIMPAYNAEKYIKEAMESILNQSFRDFEFIVLNDCSRDHTEAIIQSFPDSRIVYVKNDQNLGVAGTLNRGLALAKGEYIARMDADDISLQDRLEKQVQYLDAHPKVAVLGTNVELFDENGVISTGWSSTDPAQMKVDLLFSCGLAHPSVMMRRNVIQELGGYDLAFEGLEDYQLWCRVAKHYDVTTLPDLLFRYRIHSAQVTKNPSEKYLNRLRALKKWQLEQLELSDERVLESYFLFCRGERPETKEEIIQTAHCFEAILTANRKVREYDMSRLKSVLQTVLLNAAVKLDSSEKKSVYAETALISRCTLEWYCMKQRVKKMLRSGR